MSSNTLLKRAVSSDRTIARRPLTSQLPHHLLAKAPHLAFTCERHQRDFARLARLEAHGRAGWDVEPMPTRRGSVELQGSVGLGEVIVGTQLDRSITAVCHGEPQ